jgi:hypothetical protein
MHRPLIVYSIMSKIKFFKSIFQPRQILNTSQAIGLYVETTKFLEISNPFNLFNFVFTEPEFFEVDQVGELAFLYFPDAVCSQVYFAQGCQMLEA